MFELLTFPSFHVFMLAFCIGLLWGFVVHSILRAPRWIVGMLTND